MKTNLGKEILSGIGAALVLLGLYFGVLTLVSGWRLTPAGLFTFLPKSFKQPRSMPYA